MKKSKIRIIDIAERAGVSAGTVDRVIHGRGNVSPKAREKVLNVLEEIQYTPNIMARTLANNKTYRIIALIPTNDSDLYFKSAVNGIRWAEEANQHFGISIEIRYFDLIGPGSFEREASKLAVESPDGVLLAPIFKKEGKRVLQILRACNIPCAIFNTQLEAVDALCYIGQDSSQSGRLGASLCHRILGEGEEVIILHLEIGVDNASHLLEKEKGFLSYFNNHPEIPVAIHRIESEVESDTFIDELRVLLENDRECTVFVTTSRVHSVLDVLTEEAIRSKNFIGFDLIDPNIKYLNEGKIDFLINQNPTLQGYLGIKQLVQHLVLGQSVENETRTPLDIVVKENADYYLEQDFQQVYS